MVCPHCKPTTRSCFRSRHGKSLKFCNHLLDIHTIHAVHQIGMQKKRDNDWLLAVKIFQNLYISVLIGFSYKPTLPNLKKHPCGNHPPNHPLHSPETTSVWKSIGKYLGNEGQWLLVSSIIVKTSLPSRGLTYPTLGKGKSSSKWTFQGDMLVPWRVCPPGKTNMRMEQTI